MQYIKHIDYEDGLKREEIEEGIDETQDQYVLTSIKDVVNCKI